MAQKASPTSKIRRIPRRRGRPPGRQSGEVTREHLLRAAAAAFAEHGFRGATLADIADRAGITTGPIYNYFSSKEDLFVAASRAALDALRGGAPEASVDPAEIAAQTARAFMAPGFHQTRRLLAELHSEATRSPVLAALLSEWHQEVFQGWSAEIREESGDRAAVAKLYFLLLMGLTHIDALASIDAPQTELDDLVGRLTRSLFGPQA